MHSSILKGLRPQRLREIGFGRILVVESLAGGGMRAIIVRRRGMAIEVENAVQTPQGEMPLEQAIDFLVRLNGQEKPPKDVLLLTDEARFITLEIPVPPDDGRKNRADIEELVEKASEPYLDVPVKAAILAHTVTRSIVPAGEKQEKAHVLVSAMGLASYRRWKKALEKRGMRLQAAMPAEVAFYSAAGRNIPRDECVIVAEAREEAIGLGAILGDGGLVGYQSIPGTVQAGGGALTELAGAVAGLVYEINGAGLEVARIIVVGTGIEDREVTAALREATGGLDVTAWRSDAEVRSEKGFPLALYAPLVSAGVSWLGRERSLIPVVTDRLTLADQIRQQVHLVPLLAMILVLLGFSFHYAYMKISMQLLENRIACLGEERDSLKKEIEGANRIQAEVRRMREEGKRWADVSEFIEKTLPGRNKTKLRFFRDVRNIIPDDVVLDNMLQKAVGHYEFRGRALRAASATRFVSSLKDLDVVKDVNMPAIEELGAPSPQAEPAPGNGLFYSFVIDVNLQVK